jgi:hypothetical protein
MQQHCPSKFCDGLSGAHTCGTNSIQATIQTSYRFNILARVHYSPPGLEVHKNKTFLIPGDSNHYFPFDGTLLNFFFLWDAV